MIKILDQHTIDKIAAGEVIERPASIVKELVENSIDAGATRITVEITDGGKSMIRVTDNGGGIPKEDIQKAFYSHATSKLDNADDLVGVMTLGFRGEALSTIAAVTDTEMITKTHDALTGIRYEIRGGKEVSCEEIGAPDGTTIVARNIFFNTPARLKFLKSNMTEGSYITDLMSHIALSNPGVAVHLISQGKTLIDTSGNGDLKEAIYQLYGKEITKSILEVNGGTDEIKITGYSGKPFLSKGNRSFENYFVNTRYIKNVVINKAIEEAYKTYVMQHRFPFTVLFIEVPPEAVDVNVHPAKREFRYDNEKALFSAVYHAVADSLKEKELIPDAEADYGQRQKYFTPQPKNLSPSDAVKKTLEASSHSHAKSEDYHAFQKSTTDSMSILKSILPDSYLKKLDESTEKEASEANDKADEIKENTYGKDQVGNISDRVEEDSREQENKEDQVEDSATYSFTSRKEEEKYEQQSLAEVSYLSDEAVAKHKIIGQLFKTYWLTEFNGNLYIMDQHAAHEKVNYETYLAEFKSRTIASQQLYPPITITLSSREKTAVLENIKLFEKTGFELDDFGENDIKITSVPVNLVGLSGRDVFVEFAADLASGVRQVNEDLFVHKIATMGCKAAIKGNQEISQMEAEELMSKLLTLDNPYTCPHGRPTIIKISKDELDKKFKRIVE